MPRHIIPLSVFLLGIAALAWIGAGYLGTNTLAFAVTLLIGACYVAGALELRRYRDATASLDAAVSGLATTPASLGEWLDTLDPSLRTAVRLRVEGERVALPGPALTPYLVGLLVLLGMLGTLLGMMATLRGTGLALETATDLQAIRDSLAAPVRGLGFAFGTSIAGVATSAMLGLLSALCRRERVGVVQRLDAKIATTLRAHSQAHQREETTRLLRQQAELMPALIDRLQAMTERIEQQAAAGSERQLANQDAFHQRTEAVYAQLAASVGQSLQQGISDSARLASEALQPVVAATMEALSRETAALHDTVSRAVQQQLQAVSSGLESTSTRLSDSWNQSVTSQQQANDSLVRDLRDALDRFGDTFGQRSEGLVDAVAARLDSSVGNMADAWAQSLSRQETANDAMAGRHEQAMAAAAASFEQQAQALLGNVGQSHADLQVALAEQHRQRLGAWSEALAAMGNALREDWERAGAQVTLRQQEICDTLAKTAGDMSAQAQAHARDTIAEISRLVDTASEAPKAAADVIAELRQKLSDSMVRDTAMLEERNQMMATLDTLLGAVSHASIEQRSAIDALVSTSTDLLDRVGSRFSERVEAETGRLDAAATQVGVGAAEVASLGEAFGAAVRLFGESNERLLERLQRIENALDRALARSDEQLAYYVAQAREVIDLSALTQKQIIEDLQRVYAANAGDGAQAA